MARTPSDSLGPFYQPRRLKPVWTRGITNDAKRIMKKGRKGDFLGCLAPAGRVTNDAVSLAFQPDECGDGVPLYRRPERFAQPELTEKP